MVNDELSKSRLTLTIDHYQLIINLRKPSLSLVWCCGCQKGILAKH